MSNRTRTKKRRRDRGQCLHCSECIDFATKWICGCRHDGRCNDCHDEIVHGVIQNTSVHFAGNGRPAKGVDDDPDAYRLAHFEQGGKP